ncbi:DUF4333 domain-containing protein [Brevibacterium jeotgali]|uniref:Uncharacterized protein n=1 Tax=Brevibacterium jeotgali TaxID=1262550 RepID=A0A2H1L433_9MICO|nr:DUF4333 domain-containing protein [Brevibacterium jeotgali]TWC01785.1 uncharacterized protein DUF4333 [Brevibacterium jeotgali]SMY11530.1 protein of unknown function (DUF4333) [Brevibacterium jeotgali]
MRTTTIMRTAVAVGGFAAVMSLSACDGITINFGEGEGEGQQPGTSEPAADPDAGTAETEAAGGDGTDDDSTGESAAGGDSSDTGTSGDDTTGSGGTDTSGGDSGDDTSEQNAGFTLDENGNGEIPEDVLEDDITQAYADQGTTVDSVDCFSGMHVYSKSGSQSCDVVVAGEEYYGVVKVTDVVGQNVYYELEFAGIDF